MKRILQSYLDFLELQLSAAAPAQVAPLVKKLVKARHIFARQNDRFASAHTKNP